MAALLPSTDKKSCTASLMTFGYDPELMESNPYEGAKGSVREALAKFACLGGDYRTARLSLQEYFERPESPASWGKPASALLGALEAQLALNIPAIGGKDSMSGNYRDKAHNIDIAVPSTLIAFAAGTVPASAVRSGTFSGKAGNAVILLSQELSGSDTPPLNEWENFKANMESLEAISAAGCVCAAYPVVSGGVGVSLALMAFGNNVGIEAKSSALSSAAGAYQGSILIEIDGRVCRENPWLAEILDKAGHWEDAAVTIAEPVFRIIEQTGATNTETPLALLRRGYESALSWVYPQTSSEITTAESAANAPPEEFPLAAIIDRKPKVQCPRISRSSAAAPLVVLPVFPGTNCEWDMERAFRTAGARTRQIIFKNRNQAGIAESIRNLAAAAGEAQILALSGGFSAGDEPEGAGKFIANVFRAPAIADAVIDLLEKRDGLVLGICNGFQALIKLGLVPYGTYRAADNAMPTLTFNRIGRHISRMVRTRVISRISPWLALEEEGAVHVIPVSHGEGRLVIQNKEAEELFKKGQIPFCYADAGGKPALHEPDNPNGSDFAIEGITSPDGRILGKMGHSERFSEYLHINIPGNKRQHIFEAGVKYFS